MQPETLASLVSVGNPPEHIQRTEWAERHVEEFLSLPFVSEFVFRDLKTAEGKQKEQVADFLIFHNGTGILIQQKCQEDPASRTSKKTELWARKKAKDGWEQLRRAFTRRKDFRVWCDHPRRGRVEFPNGLPSIRHGIVIVEVFQAVDLETDAEALPLDYNGIPISYLSVNDFLNLVVHLRSVPELADYLTGRHSLPEADLRVIGNEEALFGFYLLNDGSFVGCVGRSDARIIVAAQQDRLHDALERKNEADRYASLLEHVADALATRNPRFAENLPPAMVLAYDPEGQRTNYLEIQTALADLRLRERAVLGRAFHKASERIRDRNQGFTFISARLDSMPTWVYVFGASRNVDRPELLARILRLMRGALAFYEKQNCLVVVDRDGETYEVALSRPGFNPTQEDRKLGEHFFGSLRVSSEPLRFVPEHGVP